VALQDAGVEDEAINAIAKLIMSDRIRENQQLA
jgi:hypothetical protein